MGKNSKQPSKTPTKRRQSQQLKPPCFLGIYQLLSVQSITPNKTAPPNKKTKNPTEIKLFIFFSPFYLINISKTQNTLNTC
jgi:hypothetical protein